MIGLAPHRADHNMAKPLFSIITVCYNAADTIERTLKSVDNQSFRDYEHLVLDGASTDGTQSIVGKYSNGLRSLYSEPDNGIYDAMNKGMSKASGEYLIFLNAGDAFHDAEVLADYARLIQSNHEPAVVYGQTNLVDREGNYLGPRHLKAPNELTLASFADGMMVCHQAFVVLRRIAPGFNPRYSFSSDYEWCVKCLQHARHTYGLGDRVTVDYLAEGTTTRNHFRSLRERFWIMCKYYGPVPTFFRHFRFAWRGLLRKLRNPSALQ